MLDTVSRSLKIFILGVVPKDYLAECASPNKKSMSSNSCAFHQEDILLEQHLHLYIFVIGL